MFFMFFARSKRNMLSCCYFVSFVVCLNSIIIIKSSHGYSTNVPATSATTITSSSLSLHNCCFRNKRLLQQQQQQQQYKTTIDFKRSLAVRKDLKLFSLYIDNDGDGGSSITTDNNNNNNDFVQSNDNNNDNDDMDSYKKMIGTENVEWLQTLIDQRSQARWEGNYDRADEIRKRIENFFVSKNGDTIIYEIFIQDIPRKLGGGSTWKIIPKQQPQHEDMINDDNKAALFSSSSPTVLQLAHAALGVAVEHSVQFNLNRFKKQQQMQMQQQQQQQIQQSSSLLLENAFDDNNDNNNDNNNSEKEEIEEEKVDDDYVSLYNQNKNKQLQHIVQQAKERIRYISSLQLQSPQSSSLLLLSSELSGRKSADAAFWFALSGIVDLELYEMLLIVATRELERFSERSSCRPKDIYQILERFAAAGIVVGEDDCFDFVDGVDVTPKKVSNDNNNNNGNHNGNYNDSTTTSTTTTSSSSAQLLQRVAKRALLQKQGISNNDNDDNLSSLSLLNLHSDRSLLLLWKFSTKQKKQKAFLQSAQKYWKRLQTKKENTNENTNDNTNTNEMEPNDNDNEQNEETPNSSTSTTSTSTVNLDNLKQQQLQQETSTAKSFETSSSPPLPTTTTLLPTMTTTTTIYNWEDIYDDCSRPLVIDIGCGMGVSLLGLAKHSKMKITTTDNQQQQQQRQRQRQEQQYMASSKLLLSPLSPNNDKPTTETSTTPTSTPNAILSWSDCNFAGVDLGALGIDYANGVATRLGLQGHLHYFLDSAQEFLHSVQKSYPGPIVLCMIQFPTPYRLIKTSTVSTTVSTTTTTTTTNATNNNHEEEEEEQNKGNSQLPSSAHDENFMVSKTLLQSIHSILLSSSSSPSSSSSTSLGQLLIQSNCEDVALWIRNLACTDCHYDFVDITENDNNNHHDHLLSLLEYPPQATIVPLRQPQRTLDWLAMMDSNEEEERATGPGWFPSPILPREAATETEIACRMNGTPIHRCLLKPTKY